MSTILEALKKSEQERKLNKVPTLSDIPAPQEQSRWPIILLAVLLVLALLAIIWLLVKPGASFDESQAAQAIVTPDPNPSVGEESINEQSPTTISVDIISYSQDAQQRFAIIEGKMYREGEFVKTGLKIQTIEQDSVVFNNRGEILSLQP